MKFKVKQSRITAAFFSCIFAASMPAFMTESTASANIVTANKENYTFAPVDSNIPTYSQYLDSYAEEIRPDCEITLSGTDYITAENGSPCTMTRGLAVFLYECFEHITRIWIKRDINELHLF